MNAEAAVKSGPASAAGAAPALDVDDLKAALRAGVADMKASRSDVLFLMLIYPLAGFAVVGLAAGGAVELVFPLVAGFALIGPLTAIGLYELSRRLERGEAVGLARAYRDALGRAGPRLAIIAAALLAIFAAWLLAAEALWLALFGAEPPEDFGALVSAALTTPQGWALIALGHLVGAPFAALAMALSVFSLPMLIDGERSVTRAMAASISICLANPRTMLVWGLIVGASLAIASAPALVGLVIALPLFGHATWRLYRRATEARSVTSQGRSRGSAP